VAARTVHADVQERLRQIRARLPEGLVLDDGFDFTARLETFWKRPGADHVLVDLDLPSSSADRTGGVLQQSEVLVRAAPGVKRVLALSDNPFDVFGGRPCLLVQLVPAEQGKSDREEVFRAIRKSLSALKEGTARLRDLSAPGCFPRCGYPIDVALHGPDAAAVQEWTSELGDRLKRSKKLTDVWVDSSAVPRPSRYLDIHRKFAASHGVALDDVYSAIEAYSGAVAVNHANHLGSTVRVAVSAAARAGDWANGLVRLKVRNAKGEMIPLRNIVTVREVDTPAALDFLDLWPMVELTANAGPGLSFEAAQKVCTTLAEDVRREMGLTVEYRLTWLQAIPRGK
jgi:multidrug efflux pump subunit AcrB